jgi:alpha-tubulin suppressor-like RCC1 family protein
MVTARLVFPLALAALVLQGCTDPVTEPEEGQGTLRFTRITTGVEHSCALAQTGSVYCWGSDRTGQLGTRATGDSPIPVRVESNARFVDVSAGSQHTCAVDVTGALYCWGNNNWGQLGNGSTVTLVEPFVSPTELRFTQVSGGSLHTCALTAAGVAYCWGGGGQGQLGTGRQESELRPAAVSTTLRFAKISAGGYHTCAITVTRQVFCWGQNSAGQLGNGSLLNSAVPVPVAVSPAKDVTAGAFHSCMVDESGAPYCWGSSEYGELGTSFVTPAGSPGALSPSRVAFIADAVTISAGAGFTCTTSTTGSASCWGRGFEGQLGTGQTRNWPTPQSVTQGARSHPLSFTRVSASPGTHACGLVTLDAVYCWGRGDRGQLGNSITAFTSSAMRVSTQ